MYVIPKTQRYALIYTKYVVVGIIIGVRLSNISCFSRNNNWRTCNSVIRDMFKYLSLIL